jgi:hypothetical protein
LIADQAASRVPGSEGAEGDDPRAGPFADLARLCCNEVIWLWESLSYPPECTMLAESGPPEVKHLVPGAPHDAEGQPS